MSRLPNKKPPDSALSEIAQSFKMPRSKTYRRKQPSLNPDQPLPNPSDADEETASGAQHAFRSSEELQNDSGFDFSQSSRPAATCDSAFASLSPPEKEATSPLLASAGKAAKSHCVEKVLQRPHGPHAGDDSDSCDFNE